jgi:hypothetical protein
VRQVPGNAHKEQRDRSTTRIRPDAYAELDRLDREGLETCDGGCARRWPLGLCEHHELEARLGYPVDPGRPSDYAIGMALRLVAEQREYEGADHEAAILEASKAGVISPATRNRLLEIEFENHEREVEAAALEILTTRYGWSSVGTTRERRWRSDLSAEEQRERRRLEEARFNGGLDREDRQIHKELTAYAPLEPVDWSRQPDGARRQAERLVQQRQRRARGELPRTRRVSKIDRHRMPTFETPSFRAQIGQVATATTPMEIERAVRDLRRNAKRLGLIPSGHDRRRRPPPADGI